MSWVNFGQSGIDRSIELTERQKLSRSHQRTVIDGTTVKIPSQGRDAGTLAASYGYFLSVRFPKFVADIPEGAEVIDVGSGASNLGHEVSIRRPDVRWVNADIAYEDPRIREALDAESPSNLSHVAMDIMDPKVSLGNQQFDRVFSYWLLPHIIMINRSAGHLATQNTLGLAKSEGGETRLGPIGGFRYFMPNNTVAVTAAQAVENPTIVEHIVARLTPGPLGRRLWKTEQYN